ARRLRHGEVEVGSRDRVRRADDLRELIRPARVPNNAIDRPLDLVPAAGERRELDLARLHHLRDAVKHLPTVVRGHAGPGGAGLTRYTHRVANVLPRSARHVRALGVVRATRFGPREGAPDEELVGLAHRKPAHAPSSKTYGSRP